MEREELMEGRTDGEREEVKVGQGGSDGGRK